MKLPSNLLVLLFLPLIVTLLIACNNNASEHLKTERNYVVVLSLDGVRWDQTQHTHTPNLDRIAANGVRAEAFIPVFPTGTFANHYSMATGLYPDNHGIVQNRFYCPELDADYNKGNRETVWDGRFYGGEPIWVTAKRQGIKTASFFWVGSEADVKGEQPDYWKQYQNDFPYGDRIDTVIHWLQLPEEDRPQLIMWYYHQVDSDGHRYGALGDTTLMTLSMKDSLIGIFLDKLDPLPHRDRIHFIVVSDHGMTDLSADRFIAFDQVVDTSLIDIMDGGTSLFNIKAKEGMADSLFTQLQSIENTQVWKSGTLPERLNYGNHPRVHDMVLLADLGWNIGWSWRNYTFIGAHGYDNQYADMHGIFYATGPKFKSGHVSPSFENLHLYPLMAHLLKIEPAETDANIEYIHNMLNNAE